MHEIKNDKKTHNIYFIFYRFIAAQAEQTRFIMSAPNAVEIGKQFRLSFTINEQGNQSETSPDLSNFDVLMGPSTGQSTSISTINGRTTQETPFPTHIFFGQKGRNV